MSATPASGADRAFCDVANPRHGWPCDFAAHPYNTHASWVEGELRWWSSVTEQWRNVGLSSGDQLRDAPEALRRHAERQAAS